MDASGPAAQTLDLPCHEHADLALRDAQSLFRRTLASWASDLLLLQRDGVTHLTWRQQDGGLPLAA